MGLADITSASLADLLGAEGYDIERLAKASIDELIAFPGIGEKTAQKLILDAQGVLVQPEASTVAVSVPNPSPTPVLSAPKVSPGDIVFVGEDQRPAIVCKVLDEDAGLLGVCSFGPPLSYGSVRQPAQYFENVQYLREGAPGKMRWSETQR